MGAPFRFLTLFIKRLESKLNKGEGFAKILLFHQPDSDCYRNTRRKFNPVLSRGWGSIKKGEGVPLGIEDLTDELEGDCDGVALISCLKLDMLL